MTPPKPAAIILPPSLTDHEAQPLLALWAALSGARLCNKCNATETHFPSDTDPRLSPFVGPQG